MKYNKMVILMLLVVMSLGTVASVAAQDEGLLIWADDTREVIMLEICNQFEAEFDVPCTVEHKGLDTGRDDLLNFGPAGEAADIIIVANDALGSLVTNGAIISIDLAGMDDMFTEGGLSLFTMDGQLYGVPYAIESTGFVRNTDLVPVAPETWEDVAELCLELRDSGISEYGLLIQTGDSYHHSSAWSAFGGYIFGLNEDGSYNTADIGLDSEGMLAFGDWLAAMVENGCMIPDVQDDEIFAMFEAGDVAMLITGAWHTQRLIDTGVPFEIGAFPMTADGGVASPFSGGQGFVINAFSENQLLAETFLLDYVATPETMQQLFDADPRPPVFVGVDTSSSPNVEAFTAAAANAQPMPSIPEMGSVWGAFADALTLTAQGADPVETFANADAQIVNAIETAATMGDAIVLVGSVQDEAGCAGDWDPTCLDSGFEGMGDGIYSVTITLPAGDYEYKVALGGSWAENYGVDGEFDGGNYALSLAEETEVTFTYDNNTHLLTNSAEE
jgi:arabinogalactan oligomer / maltooligosaccharide transport system substrate-binding protein